MTKDEYVQSLVDSINEVEDSVQNPEEKLPEGFVKMWIENLIKFVEASYLEYIKGKKDNFFITVEEYDNIYQNTGYDYAQSILDSLCDKGMVEMVISGDCDEIQYRATELGKTVIRKNDNN